MAGAAGAPQAVETLANEGRRQVSELPRSPHAFPSWPALHQSGGGSGKRSLIEMRPASRTGNAGSRMSWGLVAR